MSANATQQLNVDSGVELRLSDVAAAIGDGQTE